MQSWYITPFLYGSKIWCEVSHQNLCLVFPWIKVPKGATLFLPLSFVFIYAFCLCHHRNTGSRCYSTAGKGISEVTQEILGCCTIAGPLTRQGRNLMWSAVFQLLVLMVCCPHGTQRKSVTEQGTKTKMFKTILHCPKSKRKQPKNVLMGIRKFSARKGLSSIGRSCQEQWWSHHSWVYLKDLQMCHWEAQFSAGLGSALLMVGF